MKTPTPVFSKSPVTTSSNKRPEPKALSLNPIAQSDPVPKPMFLEKAVSSDIRDDEFAKLLPPDHTFDNKQIRRIRLLVEAANLKDASYILFYADEEQTKFIQSSDDIAVGMRSGDATRINVLLTQLVQTATAFDGNIDKWTQYICTGRIPLLTKLKIFLVDSTISTGTSYTDIVDTLTQVKSCITKCIKSIETTTEDIIKHLEILDQAFLRVEENLKNIQVYLAAGDIILQNFRQQIPDGSQQSSQSNPFDSLIHHQLMDSANRFERKLFDLRQLALSVAFNGSQVTVLKSNSQNIAELLIKLQSQILPIWSHKCNAIISIFQTLNPRKDVYHQLLDSGKKDECQTLFTELARTNTMFMQISN